MSGHTPGPWALSNEAATLIVQDMSAIQREGVLIGSAAGHENSGFFPSDKEAIANARLIASAPDLLNDLVAAAAVLRSYEIFHRAKQTADSDTKANANKALADRFEKTIAYATGEKP